MSGNNVPSNHMDGEGDRGHALNWRDINRVLFVAAAAVAGEASEKSGLYIGYSPPYRESQAPLEAHKSPIIPPNGDISAQQYCRER